MNALALLTQWTESGQAQLALLVYLRIQGLVLALPVFGTRYLPVRVRVGLAMALTPLYLPGGGIEAGLPMLAAMAGAELATGLATGLLVRMAAAALDTAAAAMAQSASLSQLVGIADEHSPHPLGTC